MSRAPLDLAAVGAVREAAHAVASDAALQEAAAGGDTRAALLRKAALGGGALMGGGLPARLGGDGHRRRHPFAWCRSRTRAWPRS